METFVSPLLQPAGLVVGFLAALFLGIAQQSASGDAAIGTVEQKSGRRIEYSFVILRYPRLWSSGIYLLIVGFGASIGGIHPGKDAVMPPPMR
jgi:hypothetical protein